MTRRKKHPFAPITMQCLNCLHVYTGRMLSRRCPECQKLSVVGVDDPRNALDVVLAMVSALRDASRRITDWDVSISIDASIAKGVDLINSLTGRFNKR